jgi:glycosyltransferase involved in cell wall biosynthesis
VRKRILILIKSLDRGGAEQLLVNRMPLVDTRRFEYEVAYLLPWANALVPTLEGIGVPVTCLDGGRGVGWVGRLRRVVRERPIDLVHVHSPYVAVGARLALSRKGDPPIVYTEHNVWQAYHPLTYWGNALTFPWNDHVFAVSEHVRASIRYPIPFRFRRLPPVESLYEGIDAAAILEAGRPDGVREELGIGPDQLVVGCVANFRAQKGHKYLLQAMVQVRRSIPDVRLVLVGMGPLEQEVRRMTRELGLDSTVVFAGARDDVPRVASIFDVFALSSVQEGLSIAVLEALALGKPAVVSRVGGLTEVVEDGKQGLSVPPADPRAMAEAICTVLGEPELRARMGAAALRRASHFGNQESVRRVEEVYEELLQR